MMKLMEKPIIFWVSLAALYFLLPVLLPSFYLTLIIRIMFFSLFALSLSFMSGQLGLTSLGQTAFFGVSAYTLAILTSRLGMPFPWPPILAVLLATILAVVLGLLVIRASGIYFLMITLAFGQVLWGLSLQWVSMTGGYDGVAGVRAPTVFGIDFTNQINFYYALAVVFVLVMVLMYKLINSKFGLALRGIREAPTRMESLGYPIRILKYLAFVISGALAGIAGVFYAYFTGLVNPGAIHLSRATWIMVAAVLGGMDSLLGPLLGTTIVVFLEIVVNQITDRYMIVIGTVFVLTIMFAPDGIIGRFNHLRNRSKRRNALPVGERTSS